MVMEHNSAYFYYDTTQKLMFIIVTWVIKSKNKKRLNCFRSNKVQRKYIIHFIKRTNKQLKIKYIRYK